MKIKGITLLIIIIIVLIVSLLLWKQYRKSKTIAVTDPKAPVLDPYSNEYIMQQADCEIVYEQFGAEKYNECMKAKGLV